MSLMVASPSPPGPSRVQMLEVDPDCAGQRLDNFLLRRLKGVPRIFFASSNHAIGFHPQTTRLDANSPTRPDGLYGVSKVFGEALARMYYDKFGIETASIRIGWCFPEATNYRSLSSWLSYDDLILLLERIFAVPRLGCPIIYGASDNPASSKLPARLYVSDSSIIA